MIEFPMLSFRRNHRHSSRARVPAGQRVYAVGDIHGRPDLLAELRLRILDDAARDAGSACTIVYLGDYVDRGPGSFEVIDMLLHDPLPGFESVFLKGNHEDMMLRFLAGPSDDNWLANGGDATLISYGVPLAWGRGDRRWLEDLQSRLLQRIPPDHLRFLADLQLHHSIGDYLFVHAGVRPGIPLDRQRPVDLIWIRDRFLDSAQDLGKCVVHGHSITERPEVRSNRIGIDTGAFYTNRLTGVVLEGETYRFLHT